MAASRRVSLLHLHAVRREKGFVLAKVLKSVPGVRAYCAKWSLVGVILAERVRTTVLTGVNVAINFPTHLCIQ